MINKTNTLTLFLRLTLTLCAILTAGLCGWAAETTYDITACVPIEGYVHYTTDNWTDNSASCKKKTFLNSDGTNYFYVTNKNNLSISTEKEGNFSFLKDGTTKTKVTKSFEIKNSRHIAFRLKGDSYFQIRIYFRGATNQGMDLKLGLASNNTMPDEAESLCSTYGLGDDSEATLICNVKTPAFEYTEVDGKSVETNQHYYYITGLTDKSVYLHGIEIVPILTDAKLKYTDTGSSLSTITIDSSNPIGTFPTLSASDFTASYSLDGGTTTNTISNFSDNLSFNNGEDNELWKGSKDLT